jgi:hypothetical protein
MMKFRMWLTFGLLNIAIWFGVITFWCDV